MQKKKMLIINDRNFTAQTMVDRLKWLGKYDLEFVTFPDRPDESEGDFQERMLKMEVNGPSEDLAPSGLIDVVKDINILVVHFTVIPSSVINTAKNLEFIGVLRGGWENIDLPAASKRKIPVSNSPGRSSDSVADFTIGMMLAESKNIVRASIALREGLWKQKFTNTTYCHNLKGQTIGLIGFGQVGSRVAKKLSGFEVNILVYDPYISNEVIVKAGYKPMDLDSLLKQSDFVSMHCRYNKGDKSILGSREISLMKPTAYIINNAREGLIDSDALYQALKDHKIGGAAIDVYKEEPLPKDYPFFELENVTLTPHLAGHSLDSMTAPFEILGGEIERFLKKEPLHFVKNKDLI
jgi:D-3-phosphoglycerate dehydrogenase